MGGERQAKAGKKSGKGRNKRGESEEQAAAKADGEVGKRQKRAGKKPGTGRKKTAAKAGKAGKR